MLSPSSSLLLLAKTVTHPAARSLCDSWASCCYWSTWHVHCIVLLTVVFHSGDVATMLFVCSLCDCSLLQLNREKSFIEWYVFIYHIYLSVQVHIIHSNCMCTCSILTSVFATNVLMSCVLCFTTRFSLFSLICVVGKCSSWEWCSSCKAFQARSRTTGRAHWLPIYSRC